MAESGGYAACVKGSDGAIGDKVPAYELGVHPVLKLNLKSVAFDSGSKTFSPLV